MSNAKQNVQLKVNGVNHRMPYDGTGFEGKRNLNLLTMSDTFVKTLNNRKGSEKNFSEFMMRTYGIKLFVEI